MGINVNMTGVTVRPAALPPGYYQAAVAKCEQKTSRTGNPYLSWIFNILSPEEHVGAKAFYNTSLQQTALWNLKRTLIALGFKEEDLAGNIEFEPTDLIGWECTLVVVEDVYEGETTGKGTEGLPVGEEAPIAVPA